MCRRVETTHRLFRFQSPLLGGETKKECVLEPVHLHKSW
ncbi:hypothetical protein MGWOODY_Clf155 [hydrothermal vent metagenome]|uniref:Uncharacterized protein n=1 Tax=hydrothermal vent metagenome TaxID=652676 RepID=A0A160VC22_9ZZZZ